MTGYESKRAAAQDKLLDDDDTQVYQDHPAQEPWRESASDYERGVIDGRQMQAQSSVDKAVNRMAQRPWVGLTEEEIKECFKITPDLFLPWHIYARIEAKLKEKNT